MSLKKITAAFRMTTAVLSGNWDVSTPTCLAKASNSNESMARRESDRLLEHDRPFNWTTDVSCVQTNHKMLIT